MPARERLNISATSQELELLRSVVPNRKLSRFIVDAAVKAARKLERKRLRQQIVEAYEADPEFQQQAGREWDVAALENWPHP